MKHVYVASPYSHEDKGVMYKRGERCLEFVSWWYNNQPNEWVMISPIAYMAPAERAYGLPGTWEFWANIDLAMIDRSDEVWVLMLKGVENSTGVRAEVKYAQEKGIPVKVIWQYTYAVEPLDAEIARQYGWEWHGD